MLQGKFIIFEGHDGAGKTSIIGECVKQLQDPKVQYQHGFPHNSPVDNWVDQHASSSLYYSKLVAQNVFKTIPALFKGKIILQDRYVQTVDTYAPDNLYHHNIALRSMLHPFFLQPDAYIFVTASLNVLQDRMRLKNEEHETDHHHYLLENPDVIKRRLEDYENIYQKQTALELLIDTSNQSVAESADFVINFLKERNIC